MKSKCKTFIFLFVALICMSTLVACRKDKNDQKVEHTITFVTNDDTLNVSPITSEEGAEISSKLPSFTDSADYYFGGWFTNAALTDGPITLPTKMPKTDVTYYARWYTKYLVERYLQKADLGGYELDKSLTGEINRGANEPSEIATFLSEVPQGYVLHSEGDGTPSLTLPKTGKDRNLRLDFDRAQYELVYNVNLPDDVEFSGSMPSETLVYGVEHSLSPNNFMVDGYRFMGWSLSPEGDEIIESVTPESSITVYAVWNKPIADYFGGSDLLYISPDGQSVSLVRDSIEKQGTYNANTKVFSFTREEGTLDGMVLGDVFFYFKELWQTQLSDGKGNTLELKNDGTALYGTTNGQWSLDLESGYFVFTTAEYAKLFVLKTNEDDGTLMFAFSDDEQGWYALETEDGYGYDLLYLDGFGKMSVYAVSPEDPDFDEWFDVYYGTYVLDGDGVYVANYYEGVYSSTFPFKITPQANLDPLDGVKLKGTYVFGDYRGTFVDIDNEYIDVYLDGFGSGTYYGSAGTYTIEEDSWKVDNYPTPGQYTESIVLFTTLNGDEYRISIEVEGFFVSVTADFYGRYNFEVVPESIYPGSQGDVAFIYFKGYTIYVEDGSFNDAYIWFGNYEPKYSTSGYTDEDLPLYDWRDDGMVFVVDEEQKIYRYESTREDVSFTFQITDDQKIVWKITENEAVFKDADGEKIYVDIYGVAHYKNGSTTEEAEFGMNSFLQSPTLATSEMSDYNYLVLCTFLINGKYRSFTYTAPITQIGFDGTLENLKEVKFVVNISDVGMMIVYNDDTAVVGLNMDLFAGTGYWFAIDGNLTSQDNDVYLFKANGDAPVGEDDDETQLYKEIFDRFNNLQFKLGNDEEGIYDCLENDGINYNINCQNGTLVTDGYGTAQFTPAGGDSYTCLYEMQGEDVIYLIYEFEDVAFDWYLIISPDQTGFRYANEEAGIYFTVDEYGELAEDDLVIFNGNGSAMGYYDGYTFIGHYDIVGKEYNQNGVTFTEYEITIDEYYGEDAIEVLNVVVALASTDMHVGLAYFAEVGSVASELYIYDEEGQILGVLSGNSYFGSFLVYNGQNIEGLAYRGNTIFDPRTNENGERDFAINPNGSSVVFFGYDGEEYIFDFVAGKEDEIKPRVYEYGAYQGYSDGEINENLLTLDGNGHATLKTDEIASQALLYEPFGEVEGCYRLFDDEGKTIFIFNIAIVENDNDDDYQYGYLYVYRQYVEKVEGVYVNPDWSMLVLNGYGDAHYIDEYGVVTTYEAIVVDETKILLRKSDSKADILIVLTEDGFEKTIQEFVVSADGVLLSYNGEGGSITIPDEVIRIPSGVFDGVEIDHVDFNKVEIIEAGAFEGKDLDGVNAPYLRIIGERAFANNSWYSFEEVYIPNVEEIGEAAFIGCTNIEKVTFGKIKTIATQAFASAGGTTFVIDMTGVEDLSKVEIDRDAFLALSAENLRVLVKDVNEVNSALSNNWPKKVMDNLVIWISGDSYPSTDCLVSFTSVAIYEICEGAIVKVTPDENGEISKTKFAIYQMEDDTMKLYVLKEDGSFEVTPLTVDTSSKYTLTFGDDIVFSEPAYDEYHEFTVSGDHFANATLSMTYYLSTSSSATNFAAHYAVKIAIESYSKDVIINYNGEEVNVTYAKYDASTGKLVFVADDVRYAVNVTSATTCTIEELYKQKTVTSNDSEQNFRLALVMDENNNVQSVVGMFVKQYGDTYTEVTISSCQIKENEMTITYSAGVSMEDVLKFTYDNVEDALSYEVINHIYRFSNVYYDGIYVSCEVEFDDSCKITVIKSLQFAESHGGTYVDQEFTPTYNDDGSVTVVLASGEKLQIKVTSGYSYTVSIEKA